MNLEIESVLGKLEDVEEELYQYLEKLGEDPAPEITASFETIRELVKEME